MGAAPRTDPYTTSTSAEFGWLHCGPAGAGHFVKMVHNGVEYGIMQENMRKVFNLLHEANAGRSYVVEGDAEVAPMEHPEDYQYDIDTTEVAETASWFCCCWRYLTLPLMYYATIMTISTSLTGVSAIVVKVVGLFVCCCGPRRAHSCYICCSL